MLTWSGGLLTLAIISFCVMGFLHSCLKPEDSEAKDSEEESAPGGAPPCCAPVVSTIQRIRKGEPEEYARERRRARLSSVPVLIKHQGTRDGQQLEASINLVYTGGQLCKPE